MVEDLMRDFALGGALLGSLSAVYFYAYAAVQIPVGVLLDPPQRFSLMAGLTLAAGIAGGIAAQAPLSALVESFGWRPIMLGTALLGLALCLAIVLNLSEPRTGKAAPGPAGTAPAAGGAGGLLAILRTAPVWLLTLYAACMSAPILALAGLWLAPYLVQAQGLSRAEAGALASVMLAAWAVGGPVAGWLAARVGRLPAMVGGAAI
ncbi:MAG TPA: MFS transporter, partial [Geminicoccaceae bacterium]|nr:MFS transporter [Geminicoccaceae bacterium]